MKEQHKQFLQSPRLNSLQSSVFDLKNYIEYYEKKRVRVIFNGDTLPFREQVKNWIALLQNENEKFYAYLSTYIQLSYPIQFQYANLFESIKPTSTGSISDAFKLYDRLRQILPAHFIDHTTERLTWFEREVNNPNKPFLVQNMTDEQKKELNTILNLSENTEIRQYLKQLIQLAIERAHLKSPASYSEAAEEMMAICQKLSANEVIGYVYTGGHEYRDDYSPRDLHRIPNPIYDHWEMFILKQNTILSPVFYHRIDKICNYLFSDKEAIGNQMVSKKIRDAVEVVHHYKPPIFQCHPQADETACGTLGFLYLKKHLQNSARVLHENALYFLYYNQWSLKDGLFIPSPYVLHYSQSRKYSTTLCEMINSNEDKDNYTNCPTLAGLLKKSIDIASKKNDIEIIKTNTKILQELPEFRRKWNEIAQLEQIKHQTMQVGDRNLYLAYRSYSLFSKSRRELQFTDFRVFALKTTYERYSDFPDKNENFFTNAMTYDEAVSKLRDQVKHHNNQVARDTLEQHQISSYNNWVF